MAIILQVEWNPLLSLCFVGGLIDGLSTVSVESFIRYFEGRDEAN